MGLAVIIKYLLQLAPCFFSLFPSFPATYFPPQPLTSPHLPSFVPQLELLETPHTFFSSLRCH